MKRDLFTRLLAICLVSGILIPSLSGQIAGSGFLVGVLQETGGLIPFARFDGARWSNSWPGPMDPGDPKPAALAQVPPAWIGGSLLPTAWRVWLPGGTAHAIRAQAPSFSQTNCAAIWTVMTDFPKTLNVDASRCPTRSIGIALSSNQPVQFMDQFDSGLPLTALETAFSRLENREASQRAAPTKVERTWQVGLMGTTYYVEATRRYPNQGCGLVSIFQSWIINGRVLGATVTKTDCDGKEGNSLTPMGIVELKSGTFAIVQRGAYE